MPGAIVNKRSQGHGEARAPKRQKLNKRQRAYHSSSEDEEEVPAKAGPESITQQGALEDEVDEDQVAVESPDAASDEDVALDSDDASDASSASDPSTVTAQKRKRNDPDVFATSISKILGSKLTSSKRIDPVLARSKDASTVAKAQADSRLEERARRKLREEKKQAAEKGRVRDVLGTEGVDGQTAEQAQELERRLRKTAQRGVVKLFNAVRAAQVKAEEAERDAKREGVIGVGRREEKINEMSKKGFLDLIAGGGKKPVAAAI